MFNTLLTNLDTMEKRIFPNVTRKTEVERGLLLEDLIFRIPLDDYFCLGYIKLLFLIFVFRNVKINLYFFIKTFLVVFFFFGKKCVVHIVVSFSDYISVTLVHNLQVFHMIL